MVQEEKTHKQAREVPKQELISLVNRGFPGIVSFLFCSLSLFLLLLFHYPLLLIFYPLCCTYEVANED